MAHTSPQKTSGSTGGAVAATGMNKYAGTQQQADEWGSEFVEWYNQARAQLEAAGLASQMPSLSDYQYNPNLWQQLMGAFGDTSSKTSFYNQARTNIREDINALLATIENREYNSPAAQTGRLQAAGLNPTLTGEAVDNGNTDIPQDATPDEMPDQETVTPGEVGTAVSTAFSFASSALSIVQKGIEIGTGVENLAHLNANNKIDEVKELFGSFPELTKFLTTLSPSTDWADPVTGAIVKAGDPLPAASVNAYIDSFGLRPGTAALAKKLAGKASFDENGKPTTGYQAELNKLQATSLEDAQRIVKAISSPGFSQNVGEWAANYERMYGELIQNVTQYELESAQKIAQYKAKLYSADRGEAELNAVVAGAEAEQAEAKFNEEYYNRLNPAPAAAAENTAQFARFQQMEELRLNSKIENAYLKHFEDALQDVYDKHYAPNTENALIAGIYSQRNEFMAQMAARKHELITKAGKVIGDVDWLHAGLELGTSIMDMLNPLKRIPLLNKAAKGSKK